MFLRRREPVLLTEERLDGLCPSLNRPVVDLEDLPVGPARSAIALFRDEAGQRGLVVTVRSEESGVVALFEFQGEVHDRPHQALDVGLTFAEGMGFLFDDDMLVSQQPDRHQRAVEIWCELTGDEPHETPTPVPAPAPEPMALVLEDLVEDDLEEVLPVEEAPPALPPAPVLSKFRREEGEASAKPGETGSGAQLARIPILRRRRSAADGPQTPPLLTRLLARF